MCFRGGLLGDVHLDIDRFAVFVAWIGSKTDNGAADRADALVIPLRLFVRADLWRGLTTCGEGMGEGDGEGGDGRAVYSGNTGAFLMTTL